MSAAAAPWHLVVEFVGIDLDDDHVVDALVVDPSLHIAWSSSEGATTADATIDAGTAEAAFEVVTNVAMTAVSDAAVLRVIDPLVTVSDIAEEAGVTRQAVRYWALETRQSGFPRPLDVVGDGVRVWRQADVDAWLTAAVNLGSGHRFPSAAAVAAVNNHLGRRDVSSNSENELVDDDWHIASRQTETQDESVERQLRS
jgi:predicted DNA-binding transcriptional regulator AlpA